MKTQTTIRVDESSYNKAKEILNDLGLNYSQAISVFNKMIVLNNGLPFEVKIQNTKTKKALKELENKNGKTFKNMDELFNDLDNWCIKSLEPLLLKKIIKNYKDLLKEVLIKLVNNEPLEEKYKDHKLIGNYLDCKECHIKPDLLLIYRIENQILELSLIRVGKHSELF